MCALIMNVMLVGALVFAVVSVTSQSLHCAPKNYGNNDIVCVCNSSYCDYIGPITKPGLGQYVVHTSNRDGLRLHKQVANFENRTTTIEPFIIDRNTRYQSIHGFGGAFTDSTGININSLDNATKYHLLRSYFSENGIEYNLCRVPIGGTDFSTHGYSYNDGERDTNLTNFKLAPEDYDYKIPLIQIAQGLTNNKLKLFASAWTAPKWMKSNGEYAGNGVLKTDMYQVWANYFVKFLDLYKTEDIDVWGITTGNEPSLNLIPFNKINSVGWSASMMTKWISENLGPTLRKSNHSMIKLIALDDQRFFLPWFITEIFQNNKTKSYVDGIGVHWYLNVIFAAKRLNQTHTQYPDKFLLSTEACTGSTSFEGRGVHLGSWSRGERYANDIIENLENWVTGWIDWNMALDTKGGPTYINNIVDSPIIVNASGGEFYKQPMFYAMGHFSKFVPRGSVRINIRKSTDLQVVGFGRPDNGTVLVILNKSSKELFVPIVDQSRGQMNLNISASSITTVIYW